MEAWWAALNLGPKIFYVIGIASGFMLLAQLAMTLLGFDGDDVDAMDGDVSVFSVRSVTAFFAGFGWTGVALMGNGASIPVATFGGLVVGGLFMAGVLVLMRIVYSMQASGNVNFENAVGGEATVYVPIAPAMSGTGQVELIVQGRLRVVDARTKAERKLERGEKVRVVEFSGTSTMLVEPI